MSDILQDHGYNATPVWRLLGGFLANRVGELNSTTAFRLALIDTVSALRHDAAIAWAFGWRTLCVALLFFGTNYPARYFWTGGAFLRMDWLLATIVGICLMKRERPFAAGLAIAYASLLRIFPGFLVAALILKILVASVRARRLVFTTAQRRFLAGVAIATVLLVPIASVYAGHDSWRGFIANSRKHLATPLTNNMGWHTVVAWRPSTQEYLLHDPHALDPYARWGQAQRDNFHAMRLVFLAGLVAYLALLVQPSNATTTGSRWCSASGSSFSRPSSPAITSSSSSDLASSGRGFPAAALPWLFSVLPPANSASHFPAGTIASSPSALRTSRLSSR